MSLVCMGSYVPAFILGYLSVNHDFSFGASIRKAPKTYNDIKFSKKPKTIIVVDKWFNSLMVAFTDWNFFQKFRASCKAKKTIKLAFT